MAFRKLTIRKENLVLRSTRVGYDCTRTVSDHNGLSFEPATPEERGAMVAVAERLEATVAAALVAASSVRRTSEIEVEYDAANREIRTLGLAMPQQGAIVLLPLHSKVDPIVRAAIEAL